ncbi:MAG TPA: periplasmic heavy metal sensor [Steroidobacteraceae bacterium]|nr:periplasmic heavy metal sensor [Steroidobacteraceae bacterium]
MTAFWRHLILTVALAGLAGFGGVWFGLREMRPGPPPADRLPGIISQMTHSELKDLTPDQRTAIASIEQKFVVSRDSERARIMNTNANLANALAEEMSFGPKTQAQIQTLESSVGQLQKDTVMYVLELREVLNPAQRAVFDEKVAAALMTDAR